VRAVAWSIAEVARDSGVTSRTLRHYHAIGLLREQLRLGRLIRTVDSTIGNLRRGDEMKPEKVFEGFEHNPYEAEARERWGDEAVDAGYRR
jgi:hypothetical protein